ncbi:uncharacterized protein BDZ83DRAFT_730628 [Colletotrichum acutatum]|uniref:Uncharacterized protein n=1 Tax=Glomerella acutata TaxID=27357 RepID=A0AAD8UKZ7_GLOAC|nr:uncharacterized protein BDZ83DRAFT_730628 [Colletotrichum acutatum]KAK1725223.1 hypothetical protein BDZ83DRAFT_730628 [Colletotrichum acutatum]
MSLMAVLPDQQLQKHPASLQGQPGVGTAQTVQGFPVQPLHYSEEKSPIVWILGLALPWSLGCHRRRRRRLRPSSPGSSLFDRMRRPAGQQLKNMCSNQRNPDRMQSSRLPEPAALAAAFKSSTFNAFHSLSNHRSTRLAKLPRLLNLQTDPALSRLDSALAAPLASHPLDLTIKRHLGTSKTLVQERIANSTRRLLHQLSSGLPLKSGPEWPTYA